MEATVAWRTAKPVSRGVIASHHNECAVLAGAGDACADAALPPQVAIKSSVGVFYFSDTLPLGAVHAAGLPPNPQPFTLNTKA